MPNYKGALFLSRSEQEKRVFGASLSVPTDFEFNLYCYLFVIYYLLLFVVVMVIFLEGQHGYFC